MLAKEDLKIMVVDDEVALTQLYSIALSNRGYAVTHVAHDGLGAIQAVQSDEKNIDIVIMDQKMHNVDGVAASLELKKLKPDLRIIMASAYDVPEEKRELFDVVLKKPVSNEDLLNAIKVAASKAIGTRN